MKITNELIMQYINSSNFAPTTARSEAARLRAMAPAISSGRPEKLHEHLSKTQKPYSRVTAWTRAAAFVEWLIGQGKVAAPNVYVTWRKANGRLFKGAYVRRTPDISFADAKVKLHTLPEASRRRALEILCSGMRWSESVNRIGNQVIGKGSKPREVHVPNVVGPDFKQSYSTFLRDLRRVGLKPHDLRKLALSRLVELGANEFQLMHVAGWSSLAPALSYIRVNKKQVDELMRKVAADDAS